MVCSERATEKRQPVVGSVRVPYRTATGQGSPAAAVEPAVSAQRGAARVSPTVGTVLRSPGFAPSAGWPKSMRELPEARACRVPPARADVPEPPRARFRTKSMTAGRVAGG